jgi:hypothetical protein
MRSPRPRRGARRAPVSVLIFPPVALRLLVSVRDASPTVTPATRDTRPAWQQCLSLLAGRTSLARCTHRNSGRPAITAAGVGGCAGSPDRDRRHGEGVGAGRRVDTRRAAAADRTPIPATGYPHTRGDRRHRRVLGGSDPLTARPAARQACVSAVPRVRRHPRIPAGFGGGAGAGARVADRRRDWLHLSGVPSHMGAAALPCCCARMLGFDKHEGVGD